jgi:hypothetical protein
MKHAKHTRSSLIHLLTAALVLAFGTTCRALGDVDAAPPDTGAYWPVQIDTPDGTVEMYQPQPNSFQGDTLDARAVVSLTKPGAQPAMGVAWFTARVDTEHDTRMVTLSDIAVTKVALQDATPQDQQQFTAVIDAQLPALRLDYSMDQLMTTLGTAAQQNSQAQQIQTAPPKIIFSTTPASLILVNGPPKLLPVEAHRGARTSGIMQVANTPFVLLFDSSDHHYYLKAGPRWVSAADLAGPWQDVPTVDPALTVAAEELAAPQPTTQSASTSAAKTAELSPDQAQATIIVVTEPTELIVTQGPPQFTALPGSQLLYASNTESNLFLDQSTNQYYVLLSGRWYSAASLDGPWQYVPSDQLPASFATIPQDSPKADVLPFVAVTAQAKDAVLSAQIPQTASISRDAGKDLSVSYDGDPQFQSTGAQSVTYAVNTPQSVLCVNDVYYCCDQAVWYQSSAATGPWTVCTSVPDAIYTIPPSCPVYNVSYVHAYDSGPDYVRFGYLPGYTGSYVCGGTMVYGTGYTYPGWCGAAYFAPPCTWGFAAAYDRWSCAWGFGLGVFWHPDWFAYRWHQPWWRDHWHGRPRWDPSLRRWWGPRGFTHFRDIQVALHHPALLRAAARREVGWHNLYNRPFNLARNVAIARAQQLRQPRTLANERNDAFAGRDGRVYRRTDQGWDEHRAGAWQPTHAVPEARPDYRARSAPEHAAEYRGSEAGLDRDYGARQRGAERANTVHSFGGFSGGHEPGAGRR